MNFKKLGLFMIITLVVIGFAGCAATKEIEDQTQKEEIISSKEETNKVDDKTKNEESNINEAEEIAVKDGELIYKNTQYGFIFTLPESWKDYSVVDDKWQGTLIEESQSKDDEIVGPMINIRHPEWTSENQRQDIPIMILTLEQWDSLEKGEYHIGAAPIGPRELGRNDKYIFALPARYNFAFLTGYEEVEEIIEGNPLKPIDDNN